MLYAALTARANTRIALPVNSSTRRALPIYDFMIFVARWCRGRPGTGGGEPVGGRPVAEPQVDADDGNLCAAPDGAGSQFDGDGHHGDDAGDGTGSNRRIGI